MRTNELRIGNLYNQFGVTIQATGTTISKLEKSLESQLWCKPIPLTEDWLIKLGFKLLRKDEFNDYTQIVYGKSIIKGDEDHSEKLVIYLPFNRCEIGEYNPRNDDYSYVLNVDIDYVHQLQNLFHSLSGMEL
jgi:hypothetical protein